MSAFRTIKIPSVSVRCNVWGNWWGWIGNKKTFEIGASEFDAKRWLKETTARLVEESTK